MNCFDKDDGEKMMKIIIKGMIFGAVIGMGASYIAAKDMSGTCKSMRKKTACVVRNAGRLLNKAADRMY